MRRKPSASHCVKKPPPEVYRPDSCVFFSGAQVLRISSVKAAVGQVVDHEHAVFVAERHRLAVDQHALQVRSSPCRRSGCAGTRGVALDRACG